MVTFCVPISILVTKASFLILSLFIDRQMFLHSFDLFHALLFDQQPIPIVTIKGRMNLASQNSEY